VNIDIKSILDVINSIPGGLTVAGALLWLLPRVVKKETAAKWVRGAVRALFSRIDMGGQGWRATVLFIAANAVDEADKIFDMSGRYNQKAAK
jgi:hypothetical protein